jgi:hypothetical protein
VLAEGRFYPERKLDGHLQHTRIERGRDAGHLDPHKSIAKAAGTQLSVNSTHIVLSRFQPG